MHTPPHMDELAGWVGREWGVSPWIEVPQADIDLFGRATHDMDPMHVDPEQAAKGPYGGTLVFGFQTLSLLTHLAHQIGTPRGSSYQLNYGLNRVRFLLPVRSGSRLRLRMQLADAREHALGMLVTHACTIELDDPVRPAMVAEWLGVLVRET